MKATKGEKSLTFEISQQATLADHAAGLALGETRDKGVTGCLASVGPTRYTRSPASHWRKAHSTDGEKCVSSGDTMLFKSCIVVRNGGTKDNATNGADFGSGSPPSPYEREKAIVDETVEELECLLDLAEHCEQAAVNLKVQQLILMRERNAYLEKLRQIENFCDIMRCEGDAKEIEGLFVVLRQILYSEKAAPL